METGSLRILHQALLGEALMSGDSALFGYTREELAAINARDVTTRSDEEIAEVYAMLKREPSVQQTARLRRKDGVIGAIGVVSFESTIGGLPVVVSITAPIGMFKAS